MTDLVTDDKTTQHSQIPMEHEIKFCPKYMLKRYIDVYGHLVCDFIKNNPEIKKILVKFKQEFPESPEDICSWSDYLFPRAAREIILELLNIPNFTLNFPYPR